MSVAEKLGKLRQRATQDSGLAATDAEGSILRALPEIIAVLKAAEATYDGQPSAFRGTRLEAALSALDEKLGDVT